MKGEGVGECEQPRFQDEDELKDAVRVDTSILLKSTGSEGS